MRNIRELTCNQKGNIALSYAVSFFTRENYSIFLPLNAQGSGAIDLIVSRDDLSLQRVQCKYTGRLHREMKRKYPDRQVYETFLYTHDVKYTPESFELLFVSTPQGSYLFDWHELCASKGKPPTSLQIGKKLSKFKVL